MSYLTYPVESGCKVLKNHRDARSRRARELLVKRREVRSMVREHGIGWSVRKQNNLVREACRRFPAPFRPTLENFRRAARDQLAYSYEDWNNPLDTEYYSACGYDDYMYEKREWARSAAVEYFRAWRVLREKCRA